jgi:mannosyltransferase OCH1-like enzyme
MEGRNCSSGIPWNCLSFFLLLVCFIHVRIINCDDDISLYPMGYTYPVFPTATFLEETRLETTIMCNSAMNVTANGDKIPHHLWIAVKDNATSYLQWPNIRDEIALNPTWSIHICDNNDKDSFMEKFFMNTSLLWAYSNINPVIAGASKADIWRYAMLHVYGGVYIDSDSQLKKPLSTVIKPDDEMIVAFENNHFDGN